MIYILCDFIIEDIGGTEWYKYLYSFQGSTQRAFAKTARECSGSIKIITLGLN